jgi:cytoskeletal protein RodZ
MGIGNDLAEARRSMGLTVGQLSARTRVRETLILAIERDDFSLCGGDFYARGHVRNIAKAVGLDSEALVHRYDDQHGGVPLPVRAAAVFQADTPIKIRESRSPNWTMAMAVALIILAVFGVVKTMGGGDTPTAEIFPAPAPTVPPSKASDPRRAASLTADKRGDLVVVQVKAKRTSWLDVKDGSDHVLFSGTLKEGRTSVWKAKKKLKVTFGDGGAVLLQVNGKDLGAPGRRGEVLNRSYGTSEPPAP